MVRNINSKITKNILLILSGVVVLMGLLVFSFSGTKNKDQNLPSMTPVPGGTITDSVRLEKPGPNQFVKSPLVVTGQARGTWFFEASFPVRIYDEDGKELGFAVAQADSEWMTEDFVPFHAALEFKKPSSKMGTLVLEKDNPSGLPEHSAEFRVPVKFDLDNWNDEPAVSGECKITGCSGQICSDEDVVTTCEYKAEYACYKSAKCERQSDGKCEWTPSEELVACLRSAWEIDPELQ